MDDALKFVKDQLEDKNVRIVKETLPIYRSSLSTVTSYAKPS